MKKRTIKLAAGILLAVLVIATFGIALKYIEKSGMKKGDNTPTQHSMYIDIVIDEEEYETNHNIESYLIFGIDDNGLPADSPLGYHGGMVDFLLLTILDKTTDKYTFVEIDRNTMFDVNMIGPNGETGISSFQQISGANWYGQNPTQGAENMTGTISDLFGGLPIDGYFAVGINDIHRLNNIVGGVTVSVPDDSLAKADPAFIKGAKVKLSDEQAEVFVRSRMNYGDGTNKERLARQRIFLNALFGELREKVQHNPKIAEDIFNELASTAVTDMSAKNISRIANHILSGEKIDGSDASGIVTIEGESTVGRHLDDGLEHEEFYHDSQSIVAILEKAIGLKPFSN